MRTFPQDQIDKLKATHPDIHLIEVPECGKACILKQPGRKEISAATGAMGKNPANFLQSIIKTCFLAGDNPLEDADDRDGYYLAVSSQVDELIKVKEATIKKL